MKCTVCGFEETENEKMIGIFGRGVTLQATNEKLVGLYGCPNCHTVIFSDDTEYINERKKEWKIRNRKQ